MENVGKWMAKNEIDKWLLQHQGGGGATSQRNELEAAYRHARGLAKSATMLKVALDVHSRRAAIWINPYAVNSLRHHIDCIYHHLAELERELAPYLEGADGSSDSGGVHRHCVADC